MYQNPSMDIRALLESENFSFAESQAVSDQTDKNYAEFTL